MGAACWDLLESAGRAAFVRWWTALARAIRGVRCACTITSLEPDVIGLSRGGGFAMVSVIVQKGGETD